MAFPKIYTVNGPSSTSSPTLPSWLAIKARPRNVGGHRKRTKTKHEVGQLELIQDFAFPEAAIKIKTTPDGTHAVGTGTYKPMMKVWDLEGLTVKFERVTDAENVDFVFLSDDWTKTLHLQRDRSLSLHTQSGLHHSVRLPLYGRSLAYHSPSADALIGATGTEVYRFNLDEGRYMTPLSIARGWGDGRESEVEGVNIVDVNARHGLWSFGLDGGGGVVEFWDPRSRSALTRLILPGNTLLPVQAIDPASLLAQPEKKLSVTALASHPTDGLSMAVGTSSGHTLLYDLRSPTPFAVKDQGYGEPMRCVEWLKGGGAQEDTGRVVSADSKVIKVWDKNDASSNQLSLHPPATLTHLHAVPSSGLIFVACDAAQLSSYYVPELGPAPKWAGFLDSITEEMADDPSEGGKGAFRDFKFVDRNEIDTLGLSHLIGTAALKPYMHGYFLSLKLYTTARLIANPQSYSEYRDRLVAEKLASKSESRIRARRDQPKVNKALAERLRKAEEKEEALAARKKARHAAGQLAVDGGEEEEAEKGEKGSARAGLLQDPRFQEIWQNPDFEVDEQSREFALLNPATADKNAELRATGGTGSRKTAVEEEEDESDRGSSELDEDDEDEDEESEDSDGGDLGQHDPRNLPESSRSRTLPATEASRRMAELAAQRAAKRSQPRLLNPSAISSTSRTFGQRLSSTSARPSGSGKPDGVLAMRRHVDGGMEMSFVPQTTAGADDERDEYSGGTARVERGGPPEREPRGKKVERFGAGLEKGGEEQGGEDLGTMQREGRSKRRDPGRSGSKNAFRRK